MTVEPPKPDRENKNDQTPLQDRLKDAFSNVKTPNIPGTTRDIIAYVLLIIGILLLFYYPEYGGILIGVTVGLYFSQEIFHFLKNLSEEVEEMGIARSLILGGLLLAFVLSAPYIFLGGAIAVALRQLLAHENR